MVVQKKTAISIQFKALAKRSNRNDDVREPKGNTVSSSTGHHSGSQAAIDLM